MNIKSDKLLKEIFPVSEYDLSTRDKLPVLQKLMGTIKDGPILDIGIGTGYTTYNIFKDNCIICLDIHEPNLRYFQNQLEQISPTTKVLGIVARATELPFKNGTFKRILCSEVIEHVEDDGTAVAEMARVLAKDGQAVISVPYCGFGFSSFLEAMGIKTVHDFPGPEHHFRPGYDEESIRRILLKHNLIINELSYFLKLFSRLTADFVSLVHIIYQRVICKTNSWTWSDMAGMEKSFTFQSYVFLFPIFWSFSRLDNYLRRFRGFGMVVSCVKKPD